MKAARGLLVVLGCLLCAVGICMVAWYVSGTLSGRHDKLQDLSGAPNPETGARVKGKGPFRGTEDVRMSGRPGESSRGVEEAHATNASGDSEPSIDQILRILPKEVDISFILGGQVCPDQYDAQMLQDYDGPSTKQDLPMADGIVIMDWEGSEVNCRMVDTLLSSQSIPFFMRVVPRGWRGPPLLLIAVSRERYHSARGVLIAGSRAGLLERQDWRE